MQERGDSSNVPQGWWAVVRQVLESCRRELISLRFDHPRPLCPVLGIVDSKEEFRRSWELLSTRDQGSWC